MKKRNYLLYCSKRRTTINSSWESLSSKRGTKTITAAENNSEVQHGRGQQEPDCISDDSRQVDSGTTSLMVYSQLKMGTVQ